MLRFEIEDIDDEQPQTPPRSAASSILGASPALAGGSSDDRLNPGALLVKLRRAREARERGAGDPTREALQRMLSSGQRVTDGDPTLPASKKARESPATHPPPPRDIIDLDTDSEPPQSAELAARPRRGNSL